MPVKGVDISDNNGSVDFEALKRAGVKFVLIRCGYGGDYSNQDDGEFFNNVRKAKAAGMPYGVWLYSYALNTQQAKSEAAHALRLLRQVDKPAYGVWFDMEDADHYKARNGMPTNNTLREICLIFLKEVESAGYYSGLYASLSWLENQLNDPRLDKYDKWVAQWNSTCEYAKPHGIWQYTNCWTIGDIVFDGNWAYKDYPALTGNKEEEDMTEAQVRKIAQEEFRKVEPTYNTLDQVPSWWRTEIEHLIKIGLIKGTGNGKLGLTYTRAWTGVLIYRAMKVIADEDPVYRTIDDIPPWGRPAVQALIDSGKLSGEKIEADGTRILNLPRSDVRMIVALLSNYIEDTSGEGDHTGDGK